VIQRRVVQFEQVKAACGYVTVFRPFCQDASQFCLHADSSESLVAFDDSDIPVGNRIQQSGVVETQQNRTRDTFRVRTLLPWMAGY